MHNTGEFRTFQPLKFGKKKAIIYRCYIQWEGAADMGKTIELGKELAKKGVFKNREWHLDAFPVYLSPSELAPQIIGTDSKIVTFMSSKSFSYFYMFLVLIGYHFIFDILWEILVERHTFIIRKRVYNDAAAGKFKKDEKDEEIIKQLAKEQKETLNEHLVP